MQIIKPLDPHVIKFWNEKRCKREKEMRNRDSHKVAAHHVFILFMVDIIYIYCVDELTVIDMCER